MHAGGLISRLPAALGTLRTSTRPAKRRASSVAMSTSGQPMLDTRCGSGIGLGGACSAACRHRGPPPPLPTASALTLPPCPPLPCSCSDFDRIVEEMRVYDEKREVVIKRSRDIQKLSKQHRGAHEEAAQRLAAAKAGAVELLPIIQGNPMLRQGS